MDGSVPLGGIVRIRNRAGAGPILRRPLMRAGWTLREFPLIAEQVFEVVVVPLRRRRGPGDLQAAADRVSPAAGAKGVLPAEALLFEAGGLGLGTDILDRIASAVGLAERVPPAISATVSSSFIAMRANVSRMSRAAARGSGFPFGPSGLT